MSVHAVPDWDIDMPDAPDAPEPDVAALVAADPQQQFDPAAVGQHIEGWTLMSWDEIMAQPDPLWLVRDIIPMGGFGAFIGPPKNYKSFVVIDILLCIATGLPWNGHEVKEGIVVYAAGEGRSGIKMRMQAWLAAHPEADEEKLRRNFRLLPRAPRLLQENEAAMWRATCRNVGEGLVAFVIDTWARAFLGGDENSAQEVGRAIALTEQIKEETGATGIVVHHTNADGTKARGSTALLGAVEFEINCKKDDLGQLIVSNTAQKDAPEFADKLFETVQVEHSIVLRPVDPSNVYVGSHPYAQSGPPAAGGGFGGGGFGGGPQW